VKYADVLEQFAQALKSVGGVCVRAADLAAAREAVMALPVYRDAKHVLSMVPGLGDGNVDLASVPDPHALEGLDVAILPGELAVAENGAVWVEAGRLAHRAVFVITQHLVLVVEARHVVHDMHDAYQRLDGNPPSYGLFISGPSKTADIEQSLVIGAQGARSCTVVVTGAA
jgi:L-lactate dehydrogenase complex protein LldG